MFSRLMATTLRSRTFQAFAKLLWVSTVSPDILCAVSLSTQVTPDTYTQSEVSKLNKVLSHAKTHKEFQLSYPPLDKNSLRVDVHSDASFAGNSDMSTQIGYIIVLADKHNTCHVLKFSSTKSRRIVRSTLGAEAIALATGFDAAFVLREDLRRMIGKTLPVECHLDNMSLFYVITRASATLEKRVQLDVEAVRQSYARKELTRIAFLRSAYNCADELTKLKTPGVGECIDYEQAGFPAGAGCSSLMILANDILCTQVGGVRRGERRIHQQLHRKNCLLRGKFRLRKSLDAWSKIEIFSVRVFCLLQSRGAEGRCNSMQISRVHAFATRLCLKRRR
jgi:hypothetical protein